MEENKENQNKILGWFFGIVTTLIALYGLYEKKKFDEDLENNGVYVLATITGGTMKRIDFDFSYQGKSYHGSNNGPDGKEYIGLTRFVRILEKNPSMNRIDVKIKVPKCIFESPFNGWEILPTDTCNNK